MFLPLKTYLTLHAPDIFYMPLINFSNRVKGRKANVRLHETGIYVVNDGVDNVYTCRRSRLYRYFFGIRKQCNELAGQYMLDKIDFAQGDVVVDCGANNGEIGLWAKSKKVAYYAFEPEILESRCCDLNNFDGAPRPFRKGLWFEKTILRWYSKPESADSSLIALNETENVTSIETSTLADFVTEQGIERIRLFKLEAEGAEPEVLQGALAVLDKIDYIAVDCGYERGAEKNHTFMEVYTILKEHGFEIIAAEFKRVVFLFKNTRI